MWSRFGCLLIVCCILLSRANATTIIPRSWENLAEGADFVGVVQCVEAGGIVAKYKIIESWKGVPVGSEVTMCTPPDPWGTQYPLTLCDEQFVVTAHRADSEDNFWSEQVGANPLWWRRIPFQYWTPIFEGRKSVRDEGSSYGLSRDELKSLREQTALFLKQSAPERELFVLKQLVAQRVDPMLQTTLKKANANDAQMAKQTYQAISEANSVADLVQGLMTLSAQMPDLSAQSLAVLQVGGRQSTLNALEKMMTALPITWRSGARYMFDDIRQRIGITALPKADAKIEVAPTLEQLAKARRNLEAYRKLQKQGMLSDFFDSFALLTQHEPATIVAYLMRLEPERELSYEETLRSSRDKTGYELASYFGWRCPNERPRYFRQLVSAPNEWVRVAAATYLCFETEEEGIVALHRLQELNTDAGAWAALSLARRGDKSAMSRALKVLTPTKYEAQVNYVDSQRRKDFQQRVMEIISNSAQVSGLAQPQFSLVPGRSPLLQIYEIYQAWWKKNATQVRLADPWLSILKTQKID